MYDPFRGISVFVEAVDAGGFSAAAERLNMSRSSVGKAIARLEQRLGSRLFHRTTRSISLTEDGQGFYEYCQQALQAIRDGEAQIESGQQQVSGRLRVSMPVLFGRRCVAPVFSNLSRQYPELDIELSFNDRLVNLVDDGFDLVVRIGPLDASADNLVARKIAHQHMVICAAPTYLAACGIPQNIDEIHQHKTIAYGREGRINPWRFPASDDDRAVTVEPNAKLRFDDIESIADAAAAGLGLAWLPYWLIRERIVAGELATVLENRPGMVIESYALWPQTLHLPLRVRVAIDALCRDLPGFMLD